MRAVQKVNFFYKHTEPDFWWKFKHKHNRARIRNFICL